MSTPEQENTNREEIIEVINRLAFEFVLPNGCLKLEEFLQKTDIPEEKKEEARVLARQIIELGLRDDTDIYDAFECSRALGETEAIVKRMRAGFVGNLSGGRPHFDLIRTALAFGDEQDIKKAVSMWGPTENSLHVLNGQLNLGPIKEISERIRTGIKRYAQDFSLPQNVEVSSPHINAAIEIAKQGYDLVVGIQQGCASMSTMLEMAGQNTRYIRYSREKKRKKPYWEKVGRNTEEPTRAKKIIICEDDAASGHTLKKVQPYIEKLEPETIDICFNGFHTDHSLEIARSLGFYTNISTTLSYSFDHFLQNLKTAQEAVVRLGY